MGATPGVCDRNLNGLFGDARKDAAFVLCDANFPSTTSKDTWLVLFYSQDQNTEVGKYFDVQLNKIAKDFGNDPPKGKKSKAWKHKKRIDFLADKYDFTNDLTLPKKGLSDTSPLIKVGGVCCDCSPVPAKCEENSGLVLVMFHNGKEIKLAADVRKIPMTVREVLEQMDYVKPGEPVPD